MNRTATIERNTKETKIRLNLDIDGTGNSDIKTGVGFFDHMLTLLTAHAMIDLTIVAEGDLEVDAHHTVEDVGIALGESFFQALGSKQGIRRYGHFTLPMDETLVTAALDFGGRPYFADMIRFGTQTVGNFDLELFHEFWQAFANSARCNLHLLLHHGLNGHHNGHHIAEAAFKAAARAVRMAVEMDPRQSGIPSTKGVL